MALRGLRLARGWTLAQAAAEIGRDQSTLSRYETGRSIPDIASLRGLLVTYDIVDKAKLDRWAALARAAADNDDPWVIYKDVLPEKNLDNIALEGDADEIRVYESMLIPGILQTPSYAEQIIRGGPWKLSGAEVDARLDARRLRQTRLTAENPPTLHAIIDEHALRRKMKVSICRPQCEYLLELEALGNVTIQVLPLSAGLHPGHGSLSILTYLDTDQAVAVTDSPIGDILFHNPNDVQAFRQVFDAVQARALGHKDSLATIKKVAATPR